MLYKLACLFMVVLGAVVAMLGAIRGEWFPVVAGIVYMIAGTVCLLKAHD